MLKKCEKIVNYLDFLYEKPICELNFNNNLQLLIAVILSAQCTDKRVNIVTEKLFEKCKNVDDYISLGQENLEKMIYSCGFYKNKSKNIINACKDIKERFNGEVPRDFDDLVSLSGVGRKTANVILSVAFDEDAIAVDTHVFRLSHRLGLSSANTPTKVEMDLRKKFDKHLWKKLHYQLVLFGRYKCKARNPICEECKLKDICNYYKNNK